MLAVQEYLKTRTVEDLKAELGIIVKIHDTLPLMIVNYSQIDSPKTHPVVRECRGLVLRSDTYDLIGRSFSRFFNWGEVQEEMVDFDFSNFVVQSKEDGSLVLLYHFDGHWHANTRGSFGLDKMEFQDFTWREGICKALGVASLDELDQFLDPSLTYVCEFVSPWNKVVRRYTEPTLYLLTIFRGEDELSFAEVDALVVADVDGLDRLPRRMQRPTCYAFRNIEGIQEFLVQQAEVDPTFEGVVIRDCASRRWKCKSPTYLGLHRLRGEGDNLYNPKNLLPFIMSGEQDELLTYFNEVRGAFFELKAKVLEEYIRLLELWAEHKDKVDQKEFALAIQKKTPFTSVLFNVRKKCGQGQTLADLRREWRDAESQILKWLK